MLDWISLLFYVNATVIVCSSLMIICSSYPVRSVLFLIICFISSAFLWMMLEAEFLSLALIFVYVGAVMTLFLFVVMMLNVQHIKDMNRHWFYILCVLLSTFLVLGTFYMLMHYFTPHEMLTHQGPDYSNTKAIGMLLYTQYALPLELAALLLLSGLISAVLLTFKPVKNRKRQKIADQHAVKKTDRIKLVSMKGVKPS